MDLRNLFSTDTKAYKSNFIPEYYAFIRVTVLKNICFYFQTNIPPFAENQDPTAQKLAKVRNKNILKNQVWASPNKKINVNTV